MLAQTRRFRVFVLAALAVIALALTASLGQHGRASAHTPHPGLDFSFAIDTNGDMVPDCGTGVGQPAKCTAPLGAPLTALVYLNSFGGLPNYSAFDISVQYSGVSSKDNPDAHAWPDCAYDVEHFQPGLVAWACARGERPAPESTYIGLIGTTSFNCTNSGTITLLHGESSTFLATSINFPDVESHAEGEGLIEPLTVNCAAPIGGVARDVGPDPAPAEREATAGGDTLVGWDGLAFGALAVLGLGGLGWAATRRRARPAPSRNDVCGRR